LDIYLLKAVEARNQKSYLEATRILEYVVRQYPRSINAKLELATTYAWQKRYEAAIEQYNAVLAQEKQNIAARNGLGRIQSWRNQSEAAITTFQGVLREEPNNLEAMLGMAFTYTLKRNIKQAKYYYESVLNIDPNNTEAKEGLINLYPPKRSDITLSTGVLTVSDGHDVVQHVLEFSQQLRNRNWSVTGAAFRANDTNRFQNGIHLGLMRQLGVGGSFGASVYTSFGDFGKRYSLAFDATKQLSSNLTLLGTVRPGINTDKQFEWIAGGGMLWQMSRDSYALGQYFAENLYGLEPAHTVTATTYLAVLPHFALQPSVFFHANRHDNAHNILNYSLGVHFRWTNKLSLGAHYGLGKNQKQQLGFTLRIRR
jgi:tetratricopeptide (TPR) repeat protein